MSSNIEDIINWSDEDFKKAVNFNQFIDDNRLEKQSKIMIVTCTKCGEKFAIPRKCGRPPKYCSDECRGVAIQQQSRRKSHKWYHRNKRNLSEKQRWGLGSGTLGQHRHNDFTKEEMTIKRELVRLKLKRR